MQNTLWRAQTQSRKLSLFAEEFFRRIAEATGTRIQLRKSDLYRLIERLDPASIDPEVAAKLDAILKLLAANRTLQTPIHPDRAHRTVQGIQGSLLAPTAGDDMGLSPEK